VATRQVAGGGRLVEVPPERLERWLAGFAERHGAVIEQPCEGGVELVAADGSRARCAPAFPPLAEPTQAALLVHARHDRRVGVLLVRLGGHAAGVFTGRALEVSKVGSRQVHGRSSAGGWSQQRFARRRAGQVSVAQEAAADVAARILLPQLGSLEAVITGGDRTALTAVLADRRLAALLPLVTARVLDVADPRRDVLEAAVDAARAVQITLLDPA